MSWFNNCNCNDNRTCCTKNNSTNPIRIIVTGERGPAGPIGPTGAAGADAVITTSLLANEVIQAVATDTALNLGTAVSQSGSGITFAPPSTVTLNPGTYLITGTGLASATTGSEGMSLVVDGTAVPTASPYTTASTTPNTITLQHVLTVADGATNTITLENQSGNEVSYEDLTLSIVKLA